MALRCPINVLRHTQSVHYGKRLLSQRAKAELECTTAGARYQTKYSVQLFV